MHKTAAAPICLIENHSQALSLWCSYGLRKATLVHLDAHLDINWLPRRFIRRMCEAATPEAVRALEGDVINGTTRGCYHIGDFIYPALCLGLVERVIWVQPQSHSAHTSRKLRAYLAENVQGLSRQNVAGVYEDSGRFSVEIFGAELVTCQLDSLPQFTGPLLLDIDVDYFTPQDEPWQPWCTPETVLSSLVNAGATGTLTTVALSVLGGYTPPPMRQLGWQIACHLAALTGQEIVDETCEANCHLPYSWGLLYLDRGKPDQALPFLEQAMWEAPGVPSRAHALGKALLSLDQTNAAMPYLRGAWQTAPDWDHFSMDYARGLATMGERAEAVKVLRAACQRSPWSAPLWRSLGIAYLDLLGDAGQAARFLRGALRLAPANVWAHFWLGRAYRALGRTEAAARQYAIGLGL